MNRRTPPPLLTEADLEALSTVSTAEREDGTNMWKQDAPPEGRALLEAPEYEGEDGG